MKRRSVAALIAGQERYKEAMPLLRELLKDQSAVLVDSRRRRMSEVAEEALRRIGSEDGGREEGAVPKTGTNEVPRTVSVAPNGPGAVSESRSSQQSDP